jgi:GxxExxY protein
MAMHRQEIKLFATMETDAYRADLLTDRIIGCIIAVHQALGPGFPESFYQRALVVELPRHGLGFETEKPYAVYYHGHEVGRHRIDLLVEGRVIVELKTVANLSRAHYAQVRSYLKATGVEVALLVNCDAARADIRRVLLRHCGGR